MTINTFLHQTTTWTGTATTSRDSYSIYVVGKKQSNHVDTFGIEFIGLSTYPLEHSLGHFYHSIQFYKRSDNFQGYSHIWHVYDMLLYQLHIRLSLDKKKLNAQLRLMQISGTI